MLSLFDGMGCGLTALKKAGIPVSEYHSYEINKDAIKIASKNHPEIIFHGDITKANFSLFTGFDLLIGGSPCQGFSSSGKRLNFKDPRSSLFFEFVRAKNEIQPTYFLLENVVMKEEWSNIISTHLKCNYELIDSSLVSAQSRKRLYWFNWNSKKILDKNIFLCNILEENKECLGGRVVGRRLINNKRYDYDMSIPIKQYLEKRFDGKANCISTVSKDSVICLKDEKERIEIKDFYNNQNFRHFSCIELERLQTLPEEYTLGVSDSSRRKLIGNGWTIDILTNLFKDL